MGRKADQVANNCKVDGSFQTEESLRQQQIVKEIGRYSSAMKA
jgi:hypothetical protein